MNQKIIDDIDKFYEHYIHNFIYHDVIAGIDGKANYMVALALVAYTEFMGGILLGKFEGNSKLKFDTFVSTYFPKCYQETERLIKSALKSDMYGIVRNGLAHEYFIKMGDSNFTIYLLKHLRCGITYEKAKKHLDFSVIDYFGDFQTACNSFYQDLITGKHVKEFQIAKAHLGF